MSRKHLIFVAALVFLVVLILAFVGEKSGERIDRFGSMLGSVAKALYPSQSISIVNFGDVMFDRGVRAAMAKGVKPLEHINDIADGSISEADFVVANLEGPIIETARKNCQQKAYSFQFASTTPALLSEAGINIVNLSNNHSNDCFSRGGASTRSYLDLGGIGHFGGGASITESFVVKTVDKIAGRKKVAFVGIDKTIEPIPLASFYMLIENLKMQNDFVVVNIHWGNEYEKVQSATQTAIAHKLIDSGADVIFGHHPHVIQPVEIYKGKAIFYSLGNFVFDQIGVDENIGIGVGAKLSNNDTGSFQIFPFNIMNKQPTAMSNESAENFCKEFLKSVSNTDGCIFKTQ